MKKQLEQLVESFKSAGLTLSDDQQKELNTFVESLEAKITEAKEEGKATAKDISIKLTEAAISEYDAEMKEATEKYIDDVKTGNFPNENEQY